MGSEPWFALREHTADVAVEATAPDLGGLFAAIADGLTAAQADRVPTGGDRFEVVARAESREAALFEYLDELIYERDVRNVLPCDHEATVTESETGWVVTASARGLPLDAVAAREVKAATYSEMAVEPTNEGWRGYVVLDV